MTDDELRLAEVILFSEFKRTGEYEQEVERVAEIRMERVRDELHGQASISG